MQKGIVGNLRAVITWEESNSKRNVDTVKNAAKERPLRTAKASAATADIANIHLQVPDMISHEQFLAIATMPDAKDA